MNYINCIQISTQPISNKDMATVEVEKVLFTSHFSHIDSVELLTNDSVRQEVITEFVEACPEGFTLVNSNSLAFHWTEEPHVLDDVITDIKQELDLGLPGKLLVDAAPLTWFRERICGWGSDFIFLDGEALTMREFFLYISGPLMNKKTFYIGSIFSCHCL